MKARLNILTDDIKTDLLFEDINDKSFFEGYFNDEHYLVKINETINIERCINNQKTIVNIDNKGKSYIEISNENGSFLFDITITKYIVNNGMIMIVYKIDDKESELKIEFI